MSRGYYAKLTEKVDYRVLTVIPPALSLIFVGIILVHGLEYGIDFKGGTWVDVLTDRQLGAAQLQEIESGLTSTGLSDVQARVGYDVDTGQEKLAIQTTTVVNDTAALKARLEPIVGTLNDYDTAVARVPEKPPVEFKENLEKRLKQGVDLNYSSGTLTIRGLDLNEAEVESYLTYHFKQPVNVTLAKKNYNIRSVGPTLGAAFRDQGFKAIIVALAFMGIVVYIAFHDLFPTVAVIQAAINDLIFAVGGMSLLGIPLEPASLGALLMLIGYSVDTDVLLTARVLKNKGDDFDVLVDDAMRTGITMTITTLTVMTIVYIVSTTLTQITTLSSIAAVLWMGLFADIFTTWITNVGLLKWYLEHSRRGGVRILGRRL
jgi:preprotein translocase subunit SecF